VIEYLISFALAFIVAFAATPIAKRVAYKVGAVDVPKDGRRMHKRPLARLGGLAIISGFLFSLLFNVVSSFFGILSPVTFSRQLLGLIIGILIIISIGFLDDVRPLKAKYKLAFQIAAALIVAYTGTRIEIATIPFTKDGTLHFDKFYILSYVLTVLWIVGITNAINLIDGLDGLAAGITAIASLSLFIVSLIYDRWDMAVLTAILAGATLGFLPYNFNPAKIIMGDTGAYFLGFVLGVISIKGTLKSYTAIAIAIPLLILGLPLFDTLFAIIRRILKRKPIMAPDRSHLHHRLIDMGLTTRQSVLILYIVSSVLGLGAIVLADKGAFTAVILIVAISAFVIGGARYMNQINSNDYEDVKKVRIEEGPPEEEGREKGKTAEAEDKGPDTGTAGIVPEAAVNDISNKAG